MKNIIKQAAPIECNKCGCVFTFSKEDIFIGSYMEAGAFLGLLPLSKRCEMVACPICNNYVKVRLNDG